MRKFRMATVLRGYNIIVGFYKESVPITIKALMDAGGYSHSQASAILAAVTHSYSKKTHGFDMPQLFELKNEYLFKCASPIPGIFEKLTKAVTYEYALSEFRVNFKNNINKV